MKVRVVPNAKRFGVALRDGVPVIRVPAPAEGNRANACLVRELEKRLGVRVTIVAGHKSREKTLAFEGLTGEQALTRLAGESQKTP